MVSNRRWTRGAAVGITLACLSQLAFPQRLPAPNRPVLSRRREGRRDWRDLRLLRLHPGDDQLGSGDRVRPGSGDAESVRVAHALQHAHREGDAAPRDQVEAVEGGKTWTFTLRKGVTFHDGNPFNSSAAKAAIMRTKKLNQGAAYIWGAVTSIGTPDPSTLVFHLKYPEALPLITSSSPGAYMYDTKAAGSQDLVKWFNAGHDAGTGPYTVNGGARFRGRARCSRVPEVLGRLERLALLRRRVPDRARGLDDVAAPARRTGHLRTEVESADMGDLQGPERFPDADVGLVPERADVPEHGERPAQEPDRSQGDQPGDRLQRHRDRAQGRRRARGRDHPARPVRAVDDPRVPDQHRRRQEADGQRGESHVTLTATYTEGDSNEQLITTLMKSDLAKIGVTLNVQALTTSTKYAKARSANPAQRQDITFIYWYPDYPDAATWFLSLLHTQNPPSFNFAYYSNKALDKQIDSITELTATNPTKAKAVYHSWEMTVYKDVPIIPIYRVQTQRVLLSSVVGYKDDPSYPDVVFVYHLHPNS